MTIQAFSGSVPGTPQSAVSETWSSPRPHRRAESPTIDLEEAPPGQCQMAGSHCQELVPPVQAIMDGAEADDNELVLRAPGSPSILTDPTSPGGSRGTKRRRTESDADVVVHIGAAPAALLAITDEPATGAAEEEDAEMQRLLHCALDLSD